MEQIFKDLVGQRSEDQKLMEELWLEIKHAYTGKKRHYHALSHLENMYAQIEPLLQQLEDKEVFLYALFYHDVIYDVLKKDNEGKSAELGAQRLQSLGLDGGKIERFKALVNSTKSHETQQDPDCNLLLDVDLCVLGQDWEDYERYAKGVREEYGIYPDILYNPGRKKVLKHFLAMNSIYKTPSFIQRFEDKAKQNLSKELEML